MNWTKWQILEWELTLQADVMMFAISLSEAKGIMLLLRDEIYRTTGFFLWLCIYTYTVMDRYGNTQLNKNNFWLCTWFKSCLFAGDLGKLTKKLYSFYLNNITLWSSWTENMSLAQIYLLSFPGWVYIPAIRYHIPVNCY